MSKVESVTVDFPGSYGGQEEPYPVYPFGNGRRVFMSNEIGEGVYGKPVVIVDGVTIHLSDPDLITPGGVVSVGLSGVGVVIPCPGLVPCNPIELSGMGVSMPDSVLSPSYVVGLSGVSSNIVS